MLDHLHCIDQVFPCHLEFFKLSSEELWVTVPSGLNVVSPIECWAGDFQHGFISDR